MKTKLIAILVIAVSSILAVTSSWNDSLIVDEIPHIDAGYSYLVKQDMRLNPEHPPLAKDLAAVPLLFLKLKQDAFQTEFWQSKVNGQWDFGRKLIYGSGNNADLIGHLAKLPMLLFFILSALLVFKWTTKLYGQKGGFVALTLFALSPTVLAHSRFVTTDMAAVFGILYAGYFFIRYLGKSSVKNFVLASVFFGVALLCKFSTALLVPFFIFLVLFKKDYKNLWRTLVIFIAGAVFILWPVYYLNMLNYPQARQISDTRSILTTVYGENNSRVQLVTWAASQPLLRPLAQYAVGLLRVTHQNLEPHETYFLGKVNFYGQHNYFPIVYFMKEPLAWWGFVIIAIFAIITQIQNAKIKVKNYNLNFKNLIDNHLAELAMLLWLLIYWGSSIQSSLNIGVRHLLPVYPFSIILVSGQLAKISYKLQVLGFKFKKLLITYNLLLITLLGWYLLENIRVFPYYLTYFNQVVGGPSGGYQYVVDSNLDWGQDLKRLGGWVKKNNIQKIELDYFGWADPAYYLGSRYIWANSTKYLDAHDFAMRNQSDGWLAVSATFLQGSQGPENKYISTNWLWLKAYTPVTVIGNSIFVYRTVLD